jgi:hypothetical protein
VVSQLDGGSSARSKATEITQGVSMLCGGCNSLILLFYYFDLLALVMLHFCHHKTTLGVLASMAVGILGTETGPD